MKSQLLQTLDSDPFCATKLKALSDPTRYSVVKALMQGPMSVGELGVVLGVEQSLLSHHLSVLRKSQLVFSERVGKSVHYRLSNEIKTETDVNGIDL